MAQTPNYNWTTPDDSAQVRQGAAAMRSLGNQIDARMKVIDTQGDAATEFQAAHGGNVVRTATQATASSSTDVALAFDSVVDESGAVSCGSGGITLNQAGVYAITGWLEVGVGSGGVVQFVVRTSGGTALAIASFARTPGTRASASAAVVYRLGNGVSLSLRYTTDAAMTISGARMTAYRVARY